MSRSVRLSPVLVLGALFGLAACGGGGGGGGASPVPASGFQITGVFPPNGSQNFDTRGKIIVTFSDSLATDEEAEENLVLYFRDSGRVIGRSVTLTVGRQIVTIQPDRELTPATWYSLRVLGEISSESSQTLGDDHVTHFRTGDGGGAPPPPPPPPGGGKVRLVGKMATGRSSHVSELLPNGQVLVAGGFDTANSITDSAELFDPVNETFAATTGSMINARGFHASVVLGDGHIFITGGATGPSFVETNSTEIYNTATGQFGASGMMNYARAFHTMTMLKDGRVLIAGGTVPGSTGSFSSRKAEVYDPSSGSFTTLPDMSVYRAGHTATRLPSGLVLLAGGNSTDLRGELFNPVTGTFSLVGGSLGSARRGHTATHIEDGVVLLMGGGTRTAELYVPSQDIFRPANSFPLYDRREQTVSLTTSGRLFFTGGSYFSGNVLFFSLTTEYYYPKSGTFGPSQLLLDNPKTRHRATELNDGRILITGGSNIDSTKPELREALIYEEEE